VVLFYYLFSVNIKPPRRGLRVGDTKVAIGCGFQFYVDEGETNNCWNFTADSAKALTLFEYKMHDSISTFIRPGKI
jgi:hypothetical protein